MAVADTLQQLATDIQSAYTTLENKGADIPTNKNTNNLMSTIQSLNVGNITSEVVYATPTSATAVFSIPITSGKVPKAIILESTVADADVVKGNMYYACCIDKGGIARYINAASGNISTSAVINNGLAGTTYTGIALTTTSVKLQRSGTNAFWDTTEPYKLTAYYWGDENIPSFTADSNYTNALACKTLLTPHVTEDNAYTIFTTDLENNKLNNQMCYIAYSKINGTVWCISGTRYSTSNGRITQVADMNSGNTSAYAMVINKGWKIYKTVIKIDGKVYKDDSELVSLIEGTITEIENKNVTSVRRSTFAYTRIKKAVFPNVTSLARDAFSNSALQVADFGKLTSIAEYVFDYCGSFTTLVIRSNSVCALNNTNAFRNTKFRNGTGGTVYVPRDLVSSYESATNWSSLESTTFAAIEDNIETLEALGLNVDEFK